MVATMILDNQESPALGLSNVSGPKESNSKIVLGNYELIKKLGEGAFAKVKLAVHGFTHIKVAIKVIEKTGIIGSDSKLLSEAKLMRLIEHPNVIQIFEVMETKKKVYLTLEYASGGSLFEYIISQGRIHESEAKILVKQMVSAFSYMHGLNIAHRDIKAENILLDYLKNIKITDFGLSISHEPKSLLSTACGSPIYSAPEVIDGKRYSGSEADVWSLGINIYAMVVGDLPFADSNVSALYASICKGHYTVPEFVSPECRNFLTKMIVVNPTERWSMSQLLDHAWLNDGTSFLDLSTDDIYDGRFRPKSLDFIDQDILNTVVKYGYEKQEAIESLLNDKFNQSAGCYYLLAYKKLHDIKVKSSPSINENPTTSDALANVLFETERQLSNNVPSNEKNGSDIKHKHGTNFTLNNVTNRKGRKLDLKCQPDDTGIPIAIKFKPRLAAIHPDTLCKVKGGTQTITHADQFTVNIDGNVKLPTIILEPPQSLRVHDRRMSYDINGSNPLAELKPSKSITRTDPVNVGGNVKVLATMAEPPQTLPINGRRVSCYDTNGGKNLVACKSAISDIAPVRNVQLPPLPNLKHNPESSKHKPQVSKFKHHFDETLYIPLYEDTVSLFKPGKMGMPKIIKQPFNCSAVINSPPEIVFKTVTDLLVKNEVEWVNDGYVCEGIWGDIKFEIEVCKIPKQDVFGIRMKRISGDTWQFKTIAAKITQQLQR